MAYPLAHNPRHEFEKWTSALIVVILILLIAPTLMTILGWRVAVSVEERSFAFGADGLRSV